MNLAWNGFYLEGSKALAHVLEKNRTLQELDLTCNRINTACLDYLLKGLKQNRSLHILRVFICYLLFIKSL